jgi:hypothetical protein
MTRRIGQPDTQADLDLRACLDERPQRSFVMVAGAGSGKTTSLIQRLRLMKSGAMSATTDYFMCQRFTAFCGLWCDRSRTT